MGTIVDKASHDADDPADEGDEQDPSCLRI
jgi:hypothetical protein